MKENVFVSSLTNDESQHSSLQRVKSQNESNIWIGHDLAEHALQNWFGFLGKLQVKLLKGQIILVYIIST